MKGFSSRVRLLLLLVVAALLIANAYLWLRPGNGEKPQFSISPTSLVPGFSGEQVVPEFNPDENRWTSGGSATRSPGPFAKAAGEGTEGGGNYVVFRMSQNATVAGFRLALLALTEAGICQAGVVDGSAHDTATPGRVRLFRIDWVLDRGHKRFCIPKPGRSESPPTGSISPVPER